METSPVGHITEVMANLAEEIKDLERQLSLYTASQESNGQKLAKKDEIKSKLETKKKLLQKTKESIKMYIHNNDDNQNIERQLTASGNMISSIPSSNIISKESHIAIHNTNQIILKGESQSNQNANRVLEELNSQFKTKMPQYKSINEKLKKLSNNSSETQINSANNEETKEKLESQKQEIETFLYNSADYYIQRCTNISYKASALSLLLAHSESQKIDVCFLIDATDSMGEWITTTTQKAVDIAKELQAKYADAKFRFAVVAYRDYKMDSKIYETKRFEIMPFSESEEELTTFLKKIEARGGDDTSEDVNGGLQRVVELKWESSGRCLVHFSDAPPHGKQFHNVFWTDSLLYDDYPTGGLEDKPWETLFTELKSIGVDYNFIPLNDQTQTMLREFERIWNSCLVYRSRSRVQANFKIHEIGATVQNFVENISIAINETIEKSMKYSYSKVPDITKSAIIPKPDFLEKSNNNQLKQTASFGEESTDFEILGTSSQQLVIKSAWDHKTGGWEVKNGTLLVGLKVDTLQELLLYKIGMVKCSIYVEPQLFAHGTFNNVHRGILTPGEFKVVLKQPINDKKPAREIEKYYNSEWKKRRLANYFANLYNIQIMKIPNLEWAQILYLDTFVFKAGDKSYMVEGYTDQAFEKYSNNVNFLDGEMVETRHLTAFAHFAFQESKQQYLFTDFQGVAGFLLTDPGMHTITKEFLDSGDNGTTGILNFAAKHECNEVCKALKLEPCKPNGESLELPKWKELAFPHTDNKRSKCRNLLCATLLENSSKTHCSKCADAESIVANENKELHNLVAPLQYPSFANLPI